MTEKFYDLPLRYSFIRVRDRSHPVSDGLQEYIGRGASMFRHAVFRLATAAGFSRAHANKIGRSGRIAEG